MKAIKTIKKLIYIFFTGIIMLSCQKDSINNLLNDNLTEDEIIAGLKEALKISTDTAVKIVSAVDGYYKDDIIKIPFPEEMNTIITNISYIPYGDQMVEQVILLMNRAAEDAANEATPIFVNAITSMTFNDAKKILYGDDSAATHYLRITTFDSLKIAFKPKISNSLSKPLIGNVSCNDAWYQLTSAYNNYYVLLYGGNSINTSLDEYVTVKALNGLFYKLYEEEKSIRKDPAARVTDLLKKVFK